MEDTPVDIEHFVDCLDRMLAVMRYDDENNTLDERKCALRHVYSNTVTHFALRSQSHGLGTSVSKMQASIQTIVRMVVYSYPKLPLDVRSDLCIYHTYTVILDDGEEEADGKMLNFCNDLVLGREQKHPWWRAVNQHLPQLLKHYGPFCSMNIFRSNLDFFQGCWIEQHKFQGYPSSHNFPEFLRRLNGIGDYVAASLFPKALFDETKHFRDITTVIAELSEWETLANDLLSFYKEIDDTGDQSNLFTNHAHCWQVSQSCALRHYDSRMTACSTRIQELCGKMDPKVAESVKAFLQGYVTWHLTNPRYRLHELVEKFGDGGTGKEFKGFWEKAREVGDVDPSTWAVPLLEDLIGKAED